MPDDTAFCAQESEAARPDLQAVWQETAPVEYEFDPVTGMPMTACPVCGILTIVEGMQTCPVCGWEQDDTLEQSARNGGLSLMEAQLNFRAFGRIDPMGQIKGDREDAEF
ncbi:MAG: CPCC family cysteine-rich protein [Butyricicoccus pullicaecorum]|nr:hypothetical protein [Butyricicoccus pullicaecorum]MDO4669622.1 CPCC family cysteine-rich protein [Butyricicoccus pullicaecorum]